MRVSREVRRFKAAVWRHYRARGRHGLVWRHTRDPYRILVSEVMLQQTQVARVERFYPRFLRRFPDFRSLARARTAPLLHAWQGMGYNRRALALRRSAGVVIAEHRGRLPCERAALESLPGIGAATAGAIRAFAHNEPEVFIETNIRRAFIHFFFGKRPRRRKVTDEELARYIQWTLGKGSREKRHPREWYWALMDYGAWLGVRGAAQASENGVAENPNRKSAAHRPQPRFAGSDRELRGKLIRALLASKQVPLGTFAKTEEQPYRRVTRVAAALVKEGFAQKKGDAIVVSR